MIKINYPISILAFIAALCSACTEQSAAVKDAPTQQICSLQENLSLISTPYSFAMANDGQFVLSDFTKVFLYSPDGEQIRQIGNAGRGPLEYLNPGCVKILNDTIYVWSANTLTFITYTMEGTPIAAYPYTSAITDFIPASEDIYIYTSGTRDENLIDIYNKRTHEVSRSLAPTSSEHRLLLRRWATGPFLLQNGDLYFSSYDEPTIFKYDVMSSEQALFSKIESTSFSVEKTDFDAIAKNSKAWSAFLDENSQVVNLFQQEGELYLLTIEGTAKYVNDVYDTSARRFGLYSASDKQQIAQYSYASIGTSGLFSSNADGLYFIKISDDEQHPYSLHKLIL